VFVVGRRAIRARTHDVAEFTVRGGQVSSHLIGFDEKSPTGIVATRLQMQFDPRRRM